MGDSCTVLKFGGTSVEDVAAFARVTEILRARVAAHPVVVVSALARMTDALVASVDAGTVQGLEPHFERHREIARRLLGAAAAARFNEDLAHARDDIARLLEAAERDPAQLPRLRDEVLSYGERLSSTLLAEGLAAAGLPATGVDARRCIVTDAAYGRATPDGGETERRCRAELEPLLAAGRIPVLGGYVAATTSGVTTTLGRGGSDYTAALVGAALNAAEIQIWTDVSGVLTADPRIVPGARTIPSLSYAEASELAYFGAKVLHPKTIRPALARKIPVRIVNSRAPDDPGTLVATEAAFWPGAVKSIAHKGGITVLQITSERMLGAYGFLRTLFEVFDRHKMPVDVVTTSEVSLSLTVEDGAEQLPAVVEELKAMGDVRVEPGRAIICVVGEGLRTTPGIAARVFETIRDINVSLISQGASRVNLTFVVEEEQAREAVARLHAALLDRVAPDPASLRAPRRGEPVEPLELARHLIDIPSVTGDEDAVARALRSYLMELGYRVELLEDVPGRPGLFATTDVPARLVFCTHLDTVPPFFPSSEDERVSLWTGCVRHKGDHRGPGCSRRAATG